MMPATPVGLEFARGLKDRRGYTEEGPAGPGAFTSTYGWAQEKGKGTREAFEVAFCDVMPAGSQRGA